VTPCPNCGASVEANAHLCPNCGIEMRTPAPPGSSPLRPKPLTGRVWTDFLLGAVVQYFVHLATARVYARGLPPPNPADPQHWNEVLGTVFMVGGEIFWAVVFGLLIYYNLRRFYPSVARGSGYATLALLVVLLGAFFTCRPVLYWKCRARERGTQVLRYGAKRRVSAFADKDCDADCFCSLSAKADTRRLRPIPQ